jgi:hypothetical protein
MIIQKKEIIKEIIKSPKQFKKYRAIVQNKSTKRIRKIDFGDNRYEQYKDSTKLKKYSNKNHNDINRRKNYFKRHSGTSFKRKALQLEWNRSKGYYNAKILSHQYLW